MITKLSGKISEMDGNVVVMEVQGVFYEIHVIKSVVERLNQTGAGAQTELVIYHYVQSDPSKSIPMLIGFNNKVEREFFLKFISVSGIGPKAAIKALSAPISEIASAIDAGDAEFLRTLPGVGEQRAREIVAKLQGKVGRFALIQDADSRNEPKKDSNLEEEACQVLNQLQYSREEAKRMVQQAVKNNPNVRSTEDLLNEVYRQKAGQMTARR